MSIQNLFSGLMGAPKPQNLPPTARVPDELILYKYDYCPFCVVVMRLIEKHGLPVIYRDTLSNPEHRQELLEINGRTQVPCLLIDGEPLLESRDIVHYLKAVFKIEE